MKFLKQSLSLLLSCCLVLATAPEGFAAQADQSAAPPRLRPRSSTSSGRATDAGTVAATRRAHRIVSGCVGGTDPRSGYLSRPNCGSRPVAAATYRSQGRTTRQRSRQAALGSQREGPRGVSFGARQHGQESVLDFIARRCLRQSTAGRDECCSGNARPRGEGGQLKKHIAGKSEQAGANHCDRTSRS